MWSHWDTGSHSQERSGQDNSNRPKTQKSLSETKNNSNPKSDKCKIVKYVQKQTLDTTTNHTTTEVLYMDNNAEYNRVWGFYSQLWTSGLSVWWVHLQNIPRVQERREGGSNTPLPSIKGEHHLYLTKNEAQF